MPRALDEWTVLPHGKLVRIDDNLLTVVGDLPMPMGDFPRRMTVVRLRDGRLVIYSAIALDEPEMKALEEYGTPAFLIVPCGIHRMDAKIWKDRYPALFVVAPAGARKKVEEVVPVDATDVDLGDPDVRFITVAGTEDNEAALLVKTSSGYTLVINDIIANLEDRPGFGGWVFRLAGFAGNAPRIPRVVSFKVVKDKSALRAQLQTWADLHGLNRIIVSHGHIVTNEPRQVLQQLAQSLAA